MTASTRPADARTRRQRSPCRRARCCGAGDEVLTFVNRNLEPYRGYHIFMRALARRCWPPGPNAQVVIVGGDEVSYGAARRRRAKLEADASWTRCRTGSTCRACISSGKVPYDRLRRPDAGQRAAHAYLTYPFVLQLVDARGDGGRRAGGRIAHRAGGGGDRGRGERAAGRFLRCAGLVRRADRRAGRPRALQPRMRAAARADGAGPL